MEFFMRRIFQLSVCTFASVLVSACKTDAVVPTENIPTAGVRFINAVPDSAGAFGLDFRFVDIVESNSHFRIAFRNNPSTSGGVTASTQIEYKNARAGQRHFVIFLDDTLQSVASTKLKDSTVTFAGGKNYTVLLWGSARAGSTPGLKLSIIEESVPDPGAQVALRVINTTGGALDVSAYPSAATPPAAPTWASVAGMSISSYVTTAPGPIKYKVQPAGGGAPLFADLLALPGEAAKSSAGPSGKIDTEALPGTTVAGSAVTLIVFPSSTAGSRAPQTAPFKVPAGSFMWDRRPPRPPGT